MSIAGDFNWLHLSDLHFGQANQSALWPNVRRAFFEDLKLLHDRTGPWSAVLFSGDLVYSGRKEEFDRLEEEVLGRMWEELTRLGSGAATLLAVPGNHDVLRPSADKPPSTIRQLLRTGGFSQVAEEFWGGDNEYLDAVRQAFGPYGEWWNNTQYRGGASIRAGILPGDFAATLQCGQLKVGVVGLNTAFLQLTAGNFLNKLVWDTKQLHATCGDADDWTSQHDVRLLITHHGPLWLTDQAKDDHPEIYPAGRFAAHLFGHMHENDLSSTSHGGGGVIRQWQTASLFGLEKFGDPPITRRKHGYSVGRIHGTPSETQIRCWPRSATKDPSGWRCIPDYDRNNLESDEGVRAEALESHAVATDPTPEERSQEDEIGNGEAGELVPIQSALAVGRAKEGLKAVARYRPKFHDGDRAVRKEEQASFEAAAHRSRCVCVVSDWGLGKEGFLGAAIERVVKPISNAEIFRLVCDESETVDAILSAADSQFGTSFQQFCALVAALSPAFLIFDEVPGTLMAGEDQERFARLIRSTLDYCPDLCLVVTTRQKPEGNSFSTVTLQPLDTLASKTYLNTHPQSASPIDDPDVIERIENWSGGLPMHLDRLLELLPASSLSAILDEEIDYVPATPGLLEPVPRALQNAVAHLAGSSNEYSRRSFRMLKVLTVLAEGETIQSIKRFYPTEPFHLQNVTELIRLSLLDTAGPAATTDDLVAHGPGMGAQRHDPPKTLRIPRQVRDYVRTLISEEERTEIIHTSTELLFGRKWREGKIHLRRELPHFSGSGGGEPGNEHIVIRSLVGEGLSKRNSSTVKRASGLGLAFAEKLLTAARFRDVVLVAGELVHLLEGTDYRQECVTAASLYGRGLRMTGKRAEAIRVLQEALEQGEAYLSNESKASLLLSIALAHETDGKEADAAEAAREVLQLVHKDSGQAVQAKAIIITSTETGFEKERQLAELQQFARSRDYKTVANNLALTLAKTGNNASESLRLQELVLKDKGDTYNRVRAIIDRTELLTKLNRLSELSFNDRRVLSAAYAYSYGQRMGTLFDRCHTALWTVLFQEHLWAPLLRLFRHSSFLMRIMGADQEERRYLRALDVIDISKLQVERATLKTELQYLDRRRSDSDTNNPETKS
jgi:tetratricopeptide (TPR) repeat protein